MAIANQLTQLNTNLGTINTHFDSINEAVNDQADLIQEIKDAIATLPAANYGTWRFKGDINYDTWRAYITNHNTGALSLDYDTGYVALTFEVNFSTAAPMEGNSVEGSNMNETDSFKVMEFHVNSVKMDSMYYYTDTDYHSSSTFYMTIGDAGAFFNEAARTITLHESPSAELLDFLNTFATSADCTLQAKTVSPSGSIQTVKPDAGYDGLSSVTVNACSGTRSITSTSTVSVVGYASAKVSDADLVASNIKKDVSILGVTGTYEGEGLTVDDMSIGVVQAMPSGDLSLTVTDPDGNFDWKTYAPTNGKVLPESIVAGKMVLGVAGAGAGSASSVTAGVSLTHATGSGKDEEVAIYYMTPEGTQGLKLVLVPPSAYATPVSTTFTTVMNAPISVQVSDSTRQLSCYLSDSEFMPLIGTDCGGTITYCVAKPGTANWPMIYVQPGPDLEALGALMDWSIIMDSDSYPTITVMNYHPSYYLIYDIVVDGEVITSAECCWPDDSSSYFIDEDLDFSANETINITNIRWSATEV